MDRDALLKVAETLRTVSDEAFDLETWWKPNCKTVGCAVGHYITAHPGCGMILKPSPYCGGCYIESIKEDDFGENLEDWEAVEEHFDLEEEDATYLFSGSMYDNPTRQAVIDRIMDFISEPA